MAIDLENDFPASGVCYVVTFWDKEEIDHLCFGEPKIDLSSCKEVKAKMTAYVEAKAQKAQN